MTKRLTTLYTIFSLLVALLINIPLLHSQSDATWTFPISDKSFAFSQDEWGNIVITENGKVTCLKPDTGENMWSVTNGSKDVQMHKVDGTQLAILDGENMQLVDLLSGEVYLEDKGSSISYQKHEAFFNKNKLLVNYKKDDESMIAVVDLKNYDQSVITPMESKGGLFSGDLRLPSSKGTIFKNKKILSCLNSSGDISEYDSGEKSMNIIGGTESGIATLVIKYKTFRGVDMGTCEIVWEHQADKQPRYYVNDDKKVLLLQKKKTIHALDMESGETLYTIETDKAMVAKPFFIDNHMYFPHGSTFKKFDVRTGEKIKEVKYNDVVKSMQWIDDSYFVYFSNGKNKIDLETMNLSFDKALGAGTTVWEETKGNLHYYLTAGEGKYILFCYENDSKRLWTQGIDGLQFKDAFLTANGVVVATEKEFEHILDADGSEEWDYKSKFNFASFTHPNGKRHYGIVSSYSFYIDHETAKLQALPKFKLKDFDANEGQSHIFVNEDSYIMKSGNNFYVRGLEGEEILTKNYKRHSNASRWMKLASAASQVGAVATGNTQEILKVTDGNGQVLHEGSMYDNGAFTRSMDSARERTANSSDLNLPFVFTKNDKKKKVFLFIDPITGEEYKSVEVREENPEFTVDTYEGILFYKNSKSDRLEAHMLDDK